MPFPLIPVAIGLSIGASTISGLARTYYGSKSAHTGLDYQLKAQRENSKYWSDYYKNTGFRPRYQYRSGAIWNPSAIASYQSSLSSAPYSYLGSLSTGSRAVIQTAYRWY